MGHLGDKKDLYLVAQRDLGKTQVVAVSLR